MTALQYLLVCGTALFSVMGVSSILPILPQLAKEFAMAESAIGILVASFTLPGVFLAAVGGIISDRLGRKTVLVPSLVLFALGALACIMATSQNEFVAARIIQGTGAASLGTLYNTLIGDLCRDETERLKALGITMMLVATGGALFPALGGLLGEWQLDAPFFLGLFALPLALLVLFTPLPTPPRAPQKLAAYARQGLACICTRRRLCLFGISFIVFGILYGPLITYFPLFANTRFDASPTQIGLVYAATILGISFGGIFMPQLGRRFSPRPLALCGAIFLCASMYLMPHMPWLWLSALPVLCYGLGQGFLYPLTMSALTGDSPDQTRSIVLAANATTIRLSQTLMSALCGLLFSLWSFDGVFSTGLVLAALLFILVPLALPQKKHFS